MIGSAQKAPVASAALTALNVAVVRQVVFKHAAEQISDKREETTQRVVETASESRARTEAAGDVIESTGDRSDAQTQNGAGSDDQSESQSPDFSSTQQRGGAVDLNV